MERTPKNYLSLVPQPRSSQRSNEAGANQDGIPSGDFVAKGLSVVMPDSCFPNMIIGDKASHPWPYLRREVEHNWYCDRRSPLIGFLNRDEAVLLHNLALQFRDKPGLEIGCWKGWSTCHLALAGVVLDVVDPILAEEEHLDSIRDSLAAAGVLGRVRLYAAASPDVVRDLAKLSRGKWNFFFVDGDHAGGATVHDTEACLEHAASDAMIVFHDLFSPDVEQGLHVLWRNGWNVLIYQTMQIMGVAWRGSVNPVAHHPDPSIHWTLPLHLTRYPVSGESSQEAALRLSRFVAWSHQENDRQIESLRAAFSASEAELKLQNHKVAKLVEQVQALSTSLHAARTDTNDRTASLTLHETALARYLERITEKDGQIKRLFLEVEKLTDEVSRLSAEPGGIRPAFQGIVASSLWRRTQPMRRLRASRFAPRLNVMLLALACRILRSVRLDEPADQALAFGDMDFDQDQAELSLDPLTPSPEFPDTGICIVTPDIVGPVKNGGIGSACYQFARLLAEEGHMVSVLFSGELSDSQKAHWRNYFGRFKIKFIALSDTAPVEKRVYGSTWFYERSWRIFDFLRKAHYSVIHFQDWQANGFWSIKAKRVGVAFEHTSLTLMTHSCTRWINEGMQQFGADPLETAKLVWAETYCMENCDILLSPSRYMIEWIRGKGVRLSERTLLAPYVPPETTESEMQVSVHIDNDHLIFFGRLETRKGLHIFCDAIRKLKMEGCPLPQKISFLGKYASVQGVSASVYLDSFKRDLPSIETRIISDFDYRQALKYIRNSNGLIVICSIMDNLPMTVIESIQHGLPFIAAATGGISELVNEQVSFEPNVDALANCLRSRATINHDGISHKYSPDSAKKMWCELNSELLANSSRALDECGNPETGTHNCPLVSVCIPYFNHSQYLEELITAFAGQTHPALEVVLVNDGSEPEASSVFNRIGQNNHDPRFKFLITENQGPGAARNHAVEASKGDLLLFFDADNLPRDSSFVSTLVLAIQRSGVDCVTTPYDIVGPEIIHINDQDVVATYRPTGPCLEAGFFENVLGDATMIIKRAVFKSMGGFPTRRAAWEDHEFLLNLCFSGFKLETLPDSTFFYRQSPAGRNQRANEFHNYMSLFERLPAAKSADLARIIASVGGPMLLARQGSPTNRLLAQ